MSRHTNSLTNPSLRFPNHQRLRSIGLLGSGGIVVGSLIQASIASAMPSGPAVFCEAYPDTSSCEGALPDCSFCHRAPPALNPLGGAIQTVLLPDEPRPLAADRFAEALPGALAEIEQIDVDEDGFTNFDEWSAGTKADDPYRFPGVDVCIDQPDSSSWRYDVCDYDARFTLARVKVDFCGHSPSYEELEALADQPDPRATVHEVLDQCLQSEYWRGRDGALWEIAHRKIRPVSSFKSGDSPGDITLADYEDDYNLFVYTQIDGHDARELLTAQFHVERSDGPPTTYTPYMRTPEQDVSLRGPSAQLTEFERRAGMLTTRWNFALNTMVAAIPRATAASAYRSFLGLDIAKMEGLEAVTGEPVDYDGKDVDVADCAVCHATLDPLAYPFSRYVGLGAVGPYGLLTGQYQPDRLLNYVETDGVDVVDTPESGWLLGEPVADLMEWAEVAVDSDQFARAIVMDYWARLLGEPPRPADGQEYTTLWTEFITTHDYRVDPMLHDLIDTEAYSVP